jgi:osmoprotectant transport system substrate-binding protein/osmoprotectant transport system permease protein
VREQLALLPEYLTAHLRLSLVALGAGILVSLPLGVAAHRSPRLERGVLGIASVVQTVPSLALLAIMVPALSALGQSSIGFLPAFIGLSLYSLLPMLRNTVTGLAGVDPALVEAARGVGMTPGQRLWRVELPLALPVIIAGVRTATVWTVGTATLSTPVGATSLGNYIFSGLQTRNLAAVLVGCVAAAALALSLDGLVRAIAVGVEQRRRGLQRAALGIAVALYLFVGGSLVRDNLGASPDRITIGAKNFTEQYVLAEILAGHVRRRAGVEVEVLGSLGSTVAFDALGAGEIDAYVDYSGTIWATIMHRESTPETRGSVLDGVRRYLEEGRGLVLAGALGFENTYALAMRRRQAESLGVTNISELALRAPELSLGADFDFFARQEWPDLVAVYGLQFRERRSMDSALMYQAAAQGAVDVITAYSTDGRIEAYDLVVLEDDRGAIPPYDAVILARGGLADDQPEALEALRELAGRIDAPRMRALNARVDRDGETPAAAAAGFLAELWSSEGR